jgi:biotin synthase
MDCAFCAQSSSNPSGVPAGPFIGEDGILAAAEKAAQSGARRFSIVSSGRAVSSDRELAGIAGAVSGIAGLGLRPDASLGLLPPDALRRLRDAGLDRYHHNIETAPSFYPSICTTRSPDESFRTVENARKAGLSVCCGGIFGLGEDPAHRVEFLETVRELDPDSVPVNFYVPVKGARIGHVEALAPVECLKIIAVARLMMPDKEIRVCAGRDRHLRSLKAAAFLAGADGMMIGDFLTTPGASVADDLRLVSDCGLTPGG